MSLSAAEEAQLTAQNGSDILPVGTSGLVTQPFAQTLDRRVLTTTLVPTSALLTMVSIVLPAGKVVTGISFVSTTQAQAGGSHLWFALYTRDLVLLAQSTDDTAAAAFAANTALRKALSAPQTCPYSGLYYLGFCAVATTMPSLLAMVATSINANGGIAGMTPITAATSTAALVGVAPNPAGALTAITGTLYGFVD